MSEKQFLVGTDLRVYLDADAPDLTNPSGAANCGIGYAQPAPRP